jgi:hypothetical protein
VLYNPANPAEAAVAPGSTNAIFLVAAMILVAIAAIGLKECVAS